MVDLSSRVQDELRRLAHGPRSDEKLGGMGSVRFIAPCPLGAPGEVLEKAKYVLQLTDEAVLRGWPKNQETPKLPDWFIERCAPQETHAEAERKVALWNTLQPDEQARVDAETEWPLRNWLYRMQPENRTWFWWDGKALDDLDHLIIAVEVDVWPFPWGALRWLFRAAGASALNAEG